MNVKLSEITCYLHEEETCKEKGHIYTERAIRDILELQINQCPKPRQYNILCKDLKRKPYTKCDSCDWIEQFLEIGMYQNPTTAKEEI